MMKDKFVISVIMPIYNTENYIAEAVESVINQTIGFEENIQLILLNDASTDHSDLLCDGYKKQYPNNVEYISLYENKGPSYCRNIGLDLASGKYVVFTDSDDKWSINAFERAVNLFEQNADLIDVVAANLEYFDAFQRPHILNINNSSDIIINANQDYSKIRTTVNCFIKSEVAKQYRFDETIFIKEDTIYINCIILRKQCYGKLASDVTYYYRRRKDGTSLVQRWFKDKRYYFDAPRQLYDILYNESMKNYGEFVPMMQCVIAYDAVVRFTEPVNHLTDEELGSYYEILHKNIQDIEDRFLLEVNYSDIETKNLLVSYKHNKDIAKLFINDKKKDKRIRNLEMHLQRNKCNYKVMKRMLQMKHQNRFLKDYFLQNGFTHIAIYGFSDIGVMLYQELKNSEIIISYLIDRNAEKISADLPIILPEGELKEVDVIVVTAVYYYAEIKDMLCTKANIPVISIEDVIG